MKKLFLLLSFLVFIVLRFYKASDFFFWHVDEDLIAMTVKRIVVDMRPQLIGFPIPGGIYLGPLIYYVLSVPYLFSGMNPLGLPYVAAILGFVTTVLVYKLGKTIFENKTIGIFSVIIFGFSYLVNVYGRIMTGLTFAPIYALLVYLLLFKLVKSRKINNVLPLGILLIFAAQDEGTSLSLLPFVAIVWYIYRFKIQKRSLYAVLALFLFSHASLLIFDLRHNFFLTRSFFGFFVKRDVTSNIPIFDSILSPLAIFPNTLSRIMFVSGEKDVASQVLPCADLVYGRLVSINPLVFLLAVVILGAFIFGQIFTNRRQVGAKIIFTHLLILVFGIFVFNLLLPGYSYEWMLAIFFPGFAFISAYILYQVYTKGLAGKILVLIFFAAFSFFNIKAIYFGSGHFGLNNKIEAVNYAISRIGDQPFSLTSLGGCFAQGYLYLFWYFGHLPSSVSGLIYDQSAITLPKENPLTSVVIVNPSKNESFDFFMKYNLFKSMSTESKKIDDIEVFIISKKLHE